jgi:peptidoglycan/LPS O-acetylase OafA/YrhL
MRAIAILLVVIGHGSSIAGNLFSAIPSIPFIDGVDLFFVLSGFLIGGILIAKIEESEKINLKLILTFLKRRWYRTLPNYYLFLMLNILLVYFNIIQGDISQFTWKFFVFMQNFSEGFVDFFWESWSLSVEEWFYIFLPFLILLFCVFLSKRRAILLTIITLSLAPLVYRMFISNMIVDDFWLDVNFRKVVITRIDTLIYGVIAAYLKFYHGAFFVKYRNHMFILGFLIIYMNMFIPDESNDFYAKTFHYTFNSIGAALLLSKMDSLKSYKQPFIGKVVTKISLISYSMYLVNLALVSQVIVKNFPPENLLQNAFWYLAYWFFTITISILIYTYFEKPIMNLREKHR